VSSGGGCQGWLAGVSSGGEGGGGVRRGRWACAALHLRWVKLKSHMTRTGRQIRC
jgi:hypothetical protein